MATHELEPLSGSLSSSSSSCSSSLPSTPSPPNHHVHCPPRHPPLKHPLYLGIRRRTSSSKWVSRIRLPLTNSRLRLGSFSSPSMAARAYDVAALSLRGPSAQLNFPESAHSLPRPRSLSPRDIQIAAAAAAATWRSQPSLSPSTPDPPVSRAARAAASMPIGSGKQSTGPEDGSRVADQTYTLEATSSATMTHFMSSTGTEPGSFRGQPALDISDARSLASHVSGESDISASSDATCNLRLSSTVTDAVSTPYGQLLDDYFGKETLLEDPYMLMDMAEAMLLPPPIHPETATEKLDDENEVWASCLWDHHHHAWDYVVPLGCAAN